MSEPGTWAVSFPMIGYAVTLIGVVVGNYWQIKGKLDVLAAKIAGMETRNAHADAETEAVKREQSAQKTTVAVMAEQVSGIKAGMEEMKAGQRETNALLRQQLAQVNNGRN